MSFATLGRWEKFELYYACGVHKRCRGVYIIPSVDGLNTRQRLPRTSQGCHDPELGSRGDVDSSARGCEAGSGCRNLHWQTHKVGAAQGLVHVHDV